MYWLKLAALLLTFLFGFYAILRPRQFGLFLKLNPDNKYSLTEIRATYGGWVCGLAGFALWQQSSLVFQCLGFGWLGAGIARILAMILDKSAGQKNYRFTIAELIIGLILVIELA